MIGNDPNYRRSSTYEYGDLHEVKIKVRQSIDGSIIWSCRAYGANEREIIACGGFPGPFEALACALEICRKDSE
jgi:hypothetical protein